MHISHMSQYIICFNDNQQGLCVCLYPRDELYNDVYVFFVSSNKPHMIYFQHPIRSLMAYLSGTSTTAVMLQAEAVKVELRIGTDIILDCIQQSKVISYSSYRSPNLYHYCISLDLIIYLKICPNHSRV